MMKFVFLAVFLFEIAQSQNVNNGLQQQLQHKRPQSYNYGTRVLPNGQVQVVGQMTAPQYSNQYSAKDAEDRRMKWVKLNRRKKKKRFKFFKKQFRKCGFPHKFKILKKADSNENDYDTVTIQLPFDDSEDTNYPRALRRSDNFNNTAAEDEMDEDDDDDDEDEVDETKTKEIKQNHLQGNNNFNRFQGINNNFNRLPVPRFRPIYRNMYPNMHLNVHPNMYPRMPLIPLNVPPPNPFIRPFRMMPIRRPWLQPTPWRIARPGFYPMQFPLREPAPGFINNIPPTNSIPMKSLKHVAVNQSLLDSTKPNDQSAVDNNVRVKYHQIQPISPYGIPQSYNQLVATPSHNSFNNPSTFNIRYSQPDYSIDGTYNDEITDKSVLPLIPKSNKINEDSEEKVVTVTPTSVWGANPIYPADDNYAVKTENPNNFDSNKNGYQNSPRLEHVRRLDTTSVLRDDNIFKDKWVPMKTIDPVRDKDESTVDSATYRTIIENEQVYSPPQSKEFESEDPEIITAEYPLEITMNQEEFDKPNKTSTPTLITKDNIDQFDPKKHLVYINTVESRIDSNSNTELKKTDPDFHIPNSNSSRIRRSGVKDMLALVSSSIRITKK